MNVKTVLVGILLAGFSASVGYFAPHPPRYTHRAISSVQPVYTHEDALRIDTDGWSVYRDIESVENTFSAKGTVDKKTGERDAQAMARLNALDIYRRQLRDKLYELDEEMSKGIDPSNYELGSIVSSSDAIRRYLDAIS